VKRRDFIRLLGGAVASWPLTARGQQATSPRRVGFLLVGLSPESKEVQVFRRELRKAGYIEGRNLVMEWRSASGDYDRVPALVADLIRSNVPRQYYWHTGSQACHIDYPHRNGSGPRSDRVRPGREPDASGRKHHRAVDDGNRTLSQTAATAEGNKSTTYQGRSLVESRPPIPPQGSRRDQGSRALFQSS
jgi:hypothetical protein